MTEEDPIADLTGQPRRARSASEAAEERLRDWLEQPLWSGAPNPIGPLPWPESACILAGLDPEASADADPAGWSLLPGALTFYGFDAFPRDRQGQAELQALVEVHIGPLLGLHLKTMPPNKAIAEAKKAEFSIPWLKTIAAEPKGSGKAKGSYAARPANWAEAVTEAERLYREGVSNKKIADLLASKGLGARSQSAVDRWIRDFRKGVTAAEKTAEFRRYREREGKA